MKKLILITFLLTGCTKELSVTKADVDLAKCLCQKYSLTDLDILLKKDYFDDKYLEFRCRNGKIFRHAEDSYTEGCSKLEGNK